MPSPSWLLSLNAAGNGCQSRSSTIWLQHYQFISAPSGSSRADLHGCSTCSTHSHGIPGEEHCLVNGEVQSYACIAHPCPMPAARLLHGASLFRCSYAEPPCLTAWLTAAVQAHRPEPRSSSHRPVAPLAGLCILCVGVEGKRASLNDLCSSSRAQCLCLGTEHLLKGCQNQLRLGLQACIGLIIQLCTSWCSGRQALCKQCAAGARVKAC